MQLAFNDHVDHYFAVKLFKKKKYDPYKVQLIEELHEKDPERCLQFCEELILRCAENLIIFL